MIDGFAGFTPYYTAVTWYGYDKSESIDYNGNNPAGIIWAAVMKNIHSNFKAAKFVKPISVKTERICSKTGLVANFGCKDTYEENFLSSTVLEKCMLHN